MSGGTYGAVFVLAVLAAYGLSYWAYRACTDRAALVGLDLIFGIPGLLLIIWGAINILFSKSSGPVLLATGLALSLPLLRSVRNLVARVTPMDPLSSIDMTGLCVVLATIALLAGSLARQASDGRIVVSTTLCADHGSSADCSGHNSTLDDYKIEFQIYKGSSNKGSVVDTITATLGKDEHDKRLEPSEGRANSSTLAPGAYTVCQLPTGVGPNGQRISLGVEQNGASSGAGRPPSADVAASCQHVAVKANKKVSVQFLDAARGPSSSKAPSPTATSQKSFSNSYLIFQTLAEIGLALAAVGWLIRRSLVQAIHRLGLDRPGWRMLAIAVGFTVLVFIVNSLAGYLTQVIQPDVSYDVQQATQSLTSNIHNPAGALLLGVGAGVGEEILLRGALQPRYGIVLTAILFALLHTQYGFSIVVIGLFATGVLLGLERKYWGTTASIITHAIFDTLTVLVVISSR